MFNKRDSGQFFAELLQHNYPFQKGSVLIKTVGGNPPRPATQMRG